MDYPTMLVRSFGEPQFIFVTLLSLLLPLSIFVGRRNVRIHRLRMLNNLAKTLDGISGDGKVDVPPVLEFIRARYVESGGTSKRARVLAWLKEIGIYFLPTTIFVAAERQWLRARGPARQ